MNEKHTVYAYVYEEKVFTLYAPFPSDSFLHNNVNRYFMQFFSLYILNITLRTLCYLVGDV